MGIRLHETPTHLGVHYGRVSRRLKQIGANELNDVAPQDLTPSHPMCHISRRGD
jgi:hypothetical protein